VKENILVAGYLLSKDRNLINRRADTLLEDLGILPLADRMPSQISGGERQRCAIARALINNPLVVFADEPTGSLNSEASRKVLDCLCHFHNKGQSIVMVTHDLKSAFRGDRIILFKDGGIAGTWVVDKENDPQTEEAMLLQWLKENGW
jgi:putative ABC transport system ATP-binding protein